MDIIIVPTYQVLVKIKCVNHEKHSEQCLVHPVILNVLLLLVFPYFIKSKVAVVLRALTTLKMKRMLVDGIVQ